MVHRVHRVHRVDGRTAMGSRGGEAQLGRQGQRPQGGGARETGCRAGNVDVDGGSVGGRR